MWVKDLSSFKSVRSEGKKPFDKNNQSFNKQWHLHFKVHYKYYSFKGYNGTVQLTLNLTKVVVVPFKLYRLSASFSKKKNLCFTSFINGHASLADRNFISIPHFSPASVIVTTLWYLTNFLPLRHPSMSPPFFGCGNAPKCHWLLSQNAGKGIL